MEPVMRKMLHKAARTASFVMMLKGAVGFGFLMAAVFGFAVPHLGIEPTVVGEGAAATVGAIIGALVALRA